MRALAFLFILILFPLIGAQAQMEQQLKKEIDKILRYDIHVDYEKVPGFTIGIIMGDSIYVFGYGNVSKMEPKVPDGNTLFEIGDVTKVFTASIISQLVQEGKLDYDASLDSYLQESNQNLYSDKLKISDLLSHTSGLPKMPYNFGAKEKEANNPYAHYTRNDLISFYREYVFDDDAERKYLFSNVNYALLGELIEKTTGISYEEALKTKLLDPLGMKDTRIQLQGEQLDRMATGYNLSGSEMENWDYQSFEAAVGIKSSVNDLLLFTKAQFKNTNNNFEELHQLVQATEIDKRTWIGRGWHILKIKRYYDLIAHSGTTSGHRAFLGFVKETSTAVVVLSNSKMGMNGLGYQVLKMINNHWKKRK